MPLTNEERAALRRRCTAVVSGRRPAPPGEELTRIGEWCRVNGIAEDVYGHGRVVDDLERRIAELLGKEAAVLLPSGTMAQAMALRIWAERAGTPHVALHPTSHLELHEEHAYAHVHGLRATLAGDWHRPLSAADLANVEDPLAAVVVELPLREAGGVLPSWDELGRLVAAAQARRVRVHMDGARLWESMPHYAPRTHAEVCAGFDSVYVSLYKALGALGGAVLAGPQDFAAEARSWRHRLGGTMVHLYPLAASAAMRLDGQLARMEAFRDKARSLAAALSQLEGARVHPRPPHTNLIHLTLPGAPEALMDARDRVALRHGSWLTGPFVAGNGEGSARTEITVLEGALELDDAAVVALFRELLALT